MKKTLIPILGLIALAALGSCGGSTDKVIDVFIYDYSDTYIGTVRTALNSELEEKGYSANFYNGEAVASTQVNQIQSSIARSPDLLIANLVDQTGNASTVAEAAKEADIPVIYFNREVPDTVVNPSDYNAVFVGTNADEAGYMQGDILASALINSDNTLNTAWDKNGDGVINYVMFRAQEGNAEADGRTRYSVERCNEKLEAAGLQPLRQLGTDNMASWNRDTAKTMMDTAVGTYGFTGANAIECVIANNDDMALGAIASLQSSGYNTSRTSFDAEHTILVVGVDATDAGKAAIDTYQMYGTVQQDGQAMAECIAALADNSLNGRGWLEGTNYTYDSASVQKIRIPYGQYTRS